jgi:spermidine/putrescine transport system permease protein
MAVTLDQAPAGKSALDRVGDFAGRHILTVAAAGTTLYLFAPIIMMMVLSFNRTEGRFDFVWHGFSLDAWQHPLAIPGLVDALAISLPLAAGVSVLATIIGTMTAYAQIRYEFWGKQILELVLLLTISTPEVIMGSALLNLFVDAETPLGIPTLLLAHVMFDIAFVAIMVKSRLRGFDLTLEHAAMDLGATAWRVFRKITLPLIMPSIVTAGLFAFMLSLDDFIISMFVSGETVTFPLFVWGEARVAMPPQIYVVGTIMFLVLTACLLANVWLNRPRSAAGSTAPAMVPA